MADLRDLGVHRVNNFYVVRSIDLNGKPFQVRNSEDPSVVWGSYETKEEANDHIQTAFMSLQVAERFADFLSDISEDLGVEKEEIRKLL